MSLQVVKQLAQTPPTTNRWREVYCIVEKVYTDRALADAVCKGIFTNAGETIDIGAETDWLTPRLPRDEEWKIEWYKFYYGLDLSHAFAVTGNEIYRSTWTSLVQSWIGQMPV